MNSQLWRQYTLKLMYLIKDLTSTLEMCKSKFYAALDKYCIAIQCWFSYFSTMKFRIRFSICS